jgi:peroxiredoxin
MDPADTSKNLADKIASDGKGRLSFPLLSDPDHKVIEAYGLRDPAYKGQNIDGIPHPAIYIINKDGKVTWAKIESDYRKRPTIVELRAALNTLK